MARPNSNCKHGLYIRVGLSCYAVGPDKMIVSGVRRRHLTEISQEKCGRLLHMGNLLPILDNLIYGSHIPSFGEFFRSLLEPW